MSTEIQTVVLLIAMLLFAWWWTRKEWNILLGCFVLAGLLLALDQIAKLFGLT